MPLIIIIMLFLLLVVASKSRYSKVQKHNNFNISPKRASGGVGAESLRKLQESDALITVILPAINNEK